MQALLRSVESAALALEDSVAVIVDGQDAHRDLHAGTPRDFGVGHNAMGPLPGVAAVLDLAHSETSPPKQKLQLSHILLNPVHTSSPVHPPSWTKEAEKREGGKRKLLFTQKLLNPHLERSPKQPASWSAQAEKQGGAPRQSVAPPFLLAPERGHVSTRTLPSYFDALDPKSLGMQFTASSRVTLLPPPPAQYQWNAAALGGVQDGSLALRKSVRAELCDRSRPSDRTLDVACTAHIRIHMQKNKSTIEDTLHATAAQLYKQATEDVHDLDLYCPVPSGFGPACALMLQDWREEYNMHTFANRTEAYIQHIGGFTGRSFANLAWTWGAPSTNNTTERSHRGAHDHVQALQVGAGHIQALANMMFTESSLDLDMKNDLRPDVWNAKVFENLHRFSNYMLYPERGGDSPIINPVAAAVSLSVPIELFDKHAPASEPPIRRVSTTVLLVPSALTLKQLTELTGVLKSDGSFVLTNAADVRKALQAQCEDGRCSWVQDMKALLSDPARFISAKQKAAAQESPKERYTFGCFIQQCCAFAVLVPVTDKSEIERLVRRWERGIPTHAHGVLSNGAQMNRELIGTLGFIYRCLCQGFLHRGSCVHVLQWMVSAEVMTPPACFCATRLGHARVGRPSGYGMCMACSVWCVCEYV